MSNVRIILLVAAVSAAVAYILVDDNHIVSDGVQSAIYVIAWSSIFSSLFLTVRHRMSR